MSTFVSFPVRCLVPAAWFVAGAAPGAEAAAGASSAKPADDNVVDAEVKEVKKG
mgnify:CR=1 FL=1